MSSDYKDLPLVEKLRYKYKIFEICGDGNAEIPRLIKEAADAITDRDAAIESLRQSYRNEFHARMEAEKERDIYRNEYELEKYGR